MKQIIVSFILSLLPFVLNAQELSVKSFSLAQGDLSAQTSPKKDNNEVNCALVKVQFVGDITDVEGNVVKPWTRKGNETWVYMTQRSRQMQIKTKEYLPLMVTFSDYGLSSLESNRTYVLTVVASSAANSNQKQRLTISFSPTNAVVLIDNKMVKTEKGTVTVSLPVGKHNYIITAQGYESEDGTINLKASAPSKLNIELTKEQSEGSNSSIVSVSTQDSGSDVSRSLNNSSSSISIPVKGLKIEMVLVEGGTFTMGAHDNQLSEASNDEQPSHKVTLSNYYIGKYEVTQKLWKAIMGKNPSIDEGDNLPVECVNWNDCQTFITKLNKLTGKKFRLPTEAEWEFSARGGNNTKCFKYSGSDNIDDIAWYDGNSSKKLHQVGTKSPNELGLYDMTGNVSEFVKDWYTAYHDEPQTNPTGPSSGSYNISRGGGFGFDAKECRTSARVGAVPDMRMRAIGFRLVLSE